MIRLYGIKNCSSVKKAIDFLNSKELSFEFLDIKKINEDELDFFLSKKSFDLLINTKGTSARKANINQDFIAKSSEDDLKKTHTSKSKPYKKTSNLH